MGRPTCFDFYGGTPEFPDVIRIIREIVSRDRQLRSVFDRFWLASLAPLMEWSAWPPRGGLSASIFGLSFRGAFSMCMSHVLQRARMAFSGLWRPHLYLVHGPLVNEYGVRVHGE